MKILIAEDELDMQKILRLYLVKAGYEVAVASNGQEAFDMLCEGQYDLLIADWMMPVMDGIELCKEVRAYSMPIKIIMLTARGESEHEIRGLTCGADDYIRKPFDPKILLLRIQKILHQQELLRCKEITLYPENQMAYLGKEELKLTQKEFLLLHIFMRNRGITLSREQLLNRVWGQDYDGDERTLDTHIRRLRGKIGREYISTFVGMGYRMDEPYE